MVGGCVPSTMDSVSGNATIVNPKKLQVDNRKSLPTDATKITPNMEILWLNFMTIAGIIVLQS